jgi:hypothetical protein
MQGQVRSDRQDNIKRVTNKVVYGRHPLPLALPEYYESEYTPQLSIVDNVSHSAGSAGLVQSEANELRLNHLLRFHEGDF